MLHTCGRPADAVNLRVQAPFTDMHLKEGGLKSPRHADSLEGVILSINDLERGSGAYRIYLSGMVASLLPPLPLQVLSLHSGTAQRPRNAARGSAVLPGPHLYCPARTHLEHLPHQRLFNCNESQIICNRRESQLWSHTTL